MMPTASERIRQARELREAALLEGMTFTVDFMVKGASRIIVKSYPNLSEANAAAARWRASNSIGSYVAHVYDPYGVELAS